MKISNPGEGQRFKKKNYFSIKKGVQVFRIFPAMGDAAEKGTWYKYHEVHFGFKGTDGKMLVFQSPEVRNHKTKMTEVSDAAKDRNSKIYAKMAELKLKLKENPEDKASAAAYAKLEEVSKRYNSEKRYYYNAMDANGNIGLLKLKTKERAALEAARKLLEAEEGVDPVKVEGAFLVFNKSGDGAMESTVQVSPHYLKTEVNGKKVNTLNTHTLSEDLYPKLESDSFDLLNLFIKPTAEEVKEMVEKGAEAVSRVAAIYRKKPEAKKEEPKTSAPAQSASSEDVLDGLGDIDMSEGEEEVQEEVAPPPVKKQEAKAAPAAAKKAAPAPAPVAEESSEEEETEETDGDAWLKEMGLD